MKEDIAKKMEESRFLVFLISEHTYPRNILDIAAAAERKHTKICYVCLSTTCDDVLAWMRPAGIDMKKFYFIDTMSSYYGEKVPDEKCFFVSSPSSLEEIKEALSLAIREKGCEVIMFDAISTLLEYKDIFSILKFTHALMTENKCSHAKKLYIVMKGDSIPEEENRRLVAELGMFADNVIEVGNV